MSKTHGLSKTKIYRTWCGMRNRCFNTNVKCYNRYGGRGITVCDEWAGSDGFKAFYDYVSKLEHFGEDGYTLDRINNNGNYEPGNVRWATVKEQARNRRSNRYAEINGENLILSDVAAKAGIDFTTLTCRLERGWADTSLLNPARKAKRYDIGNGQIMTVKEIAVASGISKRTILLRLNQGITGDELFDKHKTGVCFYDVGCGRKLTALEIAKEVGVTEGAIRQRLKRGVIGADLLKPARAK